MTRFEFNDRSDLWLKEAISPYITCTGIGNAMGRNRFNTLRRYLVFSYQPAQRGEMPSVRFRWRLVDGFLNAINSHRARLVEPSESICVDESMVRWYGRGGGWISAGLPHYVAIERKPDNGCEIQNAACDRSGIMLRLELVSAKEDERIREHESEVGHGTAVLSRLVEPWFGTGRVICADSYLASVEAADQMMSVGMHFIRSIKTATKQFPYRFLGEQEMQGRERSRVIKDMMALVWVDRNRDYFVSTVSNSLPGNDMIRKRYIEEDGEGNIAEISIRRQQAVEWYHDVSSQNDRHNRVRQDDINIEKKFEVKEWSLRVNLSRLPTFFTESWLLYKGGKGSSDHMSLHKFIVFLSTQLIDNSYDSIGTRTSNNSPSSIQMLSTPNRQVRSGRLENLTPTKEFRKTKEGRVTEFRNQGKCRACKTRKSTHICSACEDSGRGNVYICHTKARGSCHSDHIKTELDLAGFRQPNFS